MYNYNSLDDFVKEAFTANKYEIYALVASIVAEIYKGVITNDIEGKINEISSMAQNAFLEIFKLELTAKNEKLPIKERKKQLSPEDRRNILREIKSNYIEEYKSHFTEEHAKKEFPAFINYMNSIFTVN